MSTVLFSILLQPVMLCLVGTNITVSAAYTGRTGHGKTIPHASECKFFMSTVLFSILLQPGECCALSERTSRYPAAYTGRTGHGKTIPHASERKVGGSTFLF
ncbi:hypothetical protein TNCT_257951 [Trichonephila clavata]|uniref:Secreted protein n=1 Tax=Trichonephila clavata TaxID=2740835 RepID=A0A8X6FKN4_TRICU|nr:hypothetical protein TNCT_257951 [Trichonephila clavata]